MLVQSIVLIATMVILSGAILLSTLVSAKAALHQTILTKVQTAMSDATAAFVASQQSFVQSFGTEQQTWPSTKPTTEVLCGPSVVSASGSGSGSRCPYLATMSWAVTGTTAKSVANGVTPAKTADASYLATSVDEQRISATISVQVSNPTGTVVYAERSREISARIFSAPPYVVVTGVRDISTEAGSIHDAQGDTAGAARLASADNPSNKPDPSSPSRFTDTQITTTIDCLNSHSGTTAPIGGSYYDPRFHPYGNSVWSYEPPCTSGASALAGAPTGFVAPSGTTFESEPETPDTYWSTGDRNESSFAR